MGLISRHVVTGALTAVVATVAEVIADAVRSGGPEAAAGQITAGAFYLAGMYLPFGIALGLALGLVLALFQATPWTEPLRERLGSLRALFAPAPEAFASGLGALVAAAFLFVTSARAVHHFTTRYYDQELAVWTYAAVGLALVAASFVVLMAVAWATRPLGRLLGRAGSLGAVLALALAGVVAAVVIVLSQFTQILRAYDPIDLAWLPAAAVVYLSIAVAVRRALGDRPRRARISALVALVVAAGLLGVTAASYGQSNRVRTWVEQGTVAGQRLSRTWQSASDWDGDGHAFAFGGGDCDDGSWHVHPGALDEPGDGIDADCFDGDGARMVAEMGDGHYGPRPTGLPARPSFLVVTVDALRPDHLGCFGYERATSPHLDALCAESVRFEEAIAQSSRSIRSIPAMWTGLYPSQIEFGDEYLYPSLLESNTTVAEALRDAGWQTVMVMGTNYFDRTGHFFQGFEKVIQDPVYKPPRDRATRQAIAELQRLAQSSEPWLLWVHLFNVHLEYLWDHTPSRFGEDAEGRYDTEIRLADEQLAQILAALEATGERDRTVVIVASDHGEAFGEHQNQGHSTTLYEEELRALLMLDVPGVEPSAVAQRVGLFDLAPTMLNLAGLPAPRPMPARSLLPLMTDTEPAWPEQRPLFSELMPDGMFPFDQKAIHDGDRKLVWWVRDGTYQLFDLGSDPHERHDLSDDHGDEARELLGTLRAWVASQNLPDNRSRDIVARNRLHAPPAHVDHPLDARFPGFRILGFDMPRTEFRPGERIPMTFYYQVDDDIDRDLFFYVDMEGPPGYAHVHDFHAHHYPLNGHYRTYEWRAGEILRDPIEMVIPHDIRHPIEMKVTLRVLEDRQPVPFRVDGREETLLHLADVEIH